MAAKWEANPFNLSDINGGERYENGNAPDADAINAAMLDLQKGKSGPIPRQLQNKHFDGDDAEIKGQFYKYPHDYPNRWVEQQYLPDALKNAKYYEYGDNKQEQAAKEYWSKIKNGNN
jgi:putative ATPase